MARTRRYGVLIYLGCAVLVGCYATPVFARLCLAIDGRHQNSKIIPVTAGDQLRLHFKHSIYGSAVDEILILREQGLQLTELRYSEARLVEFYGHERADREDGVWVVRPEPVIFSALNLRVSNDAAMNLSLHSKADPVNFHLPPGSAWRVGISSCQQGPHG